MEEDRQSTACWPPSDVRTVARQHQDQRRGHATRRGTKKQPRQQFLVSNPVHAWGETVNSLLVLGSTATLFQDMSWVRHQTSPRQSMSRWPSRAGLAQAIHDASAGEAMPGNPGLRHPRPKCEARMNRASLLAGRARETSPTSPGTPARIPKAMSAHADVTRAREMYAA